MISLFAQAVPTPVLAVGWFLAGFAAICGLLAIVWPKTFQQLAHGGGRWIDTSKVVAKLDQRIEVDRFLLPHCRVLGVIALVAAGILTFFLTR